MYTSSLWHSTEYEYSYSQSYSYSDNCMPIGMWILFGNSHYFHRGLRMFCLFDANNCGNCAKCSIKSAINGHILSHTHAHIQTQQSFPIKASNKWIISVLTRMLGPCLDSAPELIQPCAQRLFADYRPQRHSTQLSSARHDVAWSRPNTQHST